MEKTINQAPAPSRWGQGAGRPRGHPILIQTGKIKDYPLVLVGRGFWQPLLDFVSQRLLVEETIDARDSELIAVTDSPEEAVAIIADIAMHRFGLTYGPRLRRRWFMWE